MIEDVLKFGEFSSPVEPGGLDQEQHDAVRDVFCVSDAVMLLRDDGRVYPAAWRGSAP